MNESTQVPAPAAFPRAMRDVILLSFGLLTGFAWAWFNATLKFGETQHILVGLVIIVAQMLRYLYLAHCYGAANHQRINMRFFGELIVFLVGLVVGVLWHQFYARDDSQPEVHIIVLLLVLIFSIARYLALLRREAEAKTEEKAKAKS